MISVCQVSVLTSITDGLMEEWSSPVYAFFSPVPEIIYVNGCHAHEFKCLGKGCKQKIRCFLDTGNKKSMTNM